MRVSELCTVNVSVGGEGSLGTPLDRPHKPPSSAVNLHAAPGRAETLAKVRTRYVGARKGKSFLEPAWVRLAWILWHRYCFTDEETEIWGG